LWQIFAANQVGTQGGVYDDQPLDYCVFHADGRILYQGTIAPAEYRTAERLTERLDLLRANLAAAH
jgi:hypothetical protein